MFSPARRWEACEGCTGDVQGDGSAALFFRGEEDAWWRVELAAGAFELRQVAYGNDISSGGRMVRRKVGGGGAGVSVK